METTAVTGRAARPVQEKQPSVTETDLSLAKRHFETAKEYFKRKEFGEAIREFRTSHRLSGKAELLINIAFCLNNLGRKEEAITAFQQYLATQPEPEQRQKIEGYIEILREELKQRSGTPTASAILFDDAWEDPYTHSAGSKEEDAEQPSPAASPPPVETGRPAGSAGRSYPLGGWITLGAAGLLGAASGTSFYLANRYQNQHEAQVADLIATDCINKGTSRWNSAKCQNQNQGELNNLERKKKIALGISIGTGIAAVGAAVVGGFLLWKDSQGNSLRVEPQLGPSAGFLVGYRF